jgi:hypothetical protein
MLHRLASFPRKKLTNAVFLSIFKSAIYTMCIILKILYFFLKNNKKNRIGYFFSGKASQPVQYLGAGGDFFFFEDCTWHTGIMAENGVFSEEWANMPDPSGTC